MSDRSSVRWSFVRHYDDGETTWLWQRFAPDGRVEKTSEPHATYGKVLVAALQNGFKPDQDDYSLDLPYGRMHFPPGRIPEFSPEPLPLPESTSGTIDEPPAPESRSVPRVSQGKPPLDFTISPKAWALLARFLRNSTLEPWPDRQRIDPLSTELDREKINDTRTARAICTAHT